MKQKHKSLVSLVLSTALVAGLTSAPATAQPDDFQAPLTPRVVERVWYTPAAYLSEDEELVFTFANGTGHRTPVTISVLDRFGNEISNRRVSLLDKASRRVVLFKAQGRNKPIGLVRLKINYEATCDVEFNPASMFAFRATRHFDGRYQDTLISRVEKPCGGKMASLLPESLTPGTPTTSQPEGLR